MCCCGCAIWREIIPYKTWVRRVDGLFGVNCTKYKEGIKKVVVPPAQVRGFSLLRNNEEKVENTKKMSGSELPM